MYGITLQEALEAFPPQSIKLLAGKDNLERLVTGATLIETPDVGVWIKGGELLLTTGYIYKDNPEQLLELIKELQQKKAAALGIKLNRFLDSLPKAIITEAQKLDFPVFAILTGEPTFMDIISKVYERMEEKKLIKMFRIKY